MVKQTEYSSVSKTEPATDIGNKLNFKSNMLSMYCSILFTQNSSIVSTELWCLKSEQGLLWAGEFTETAHKGGF